MPATGSAYEQDMQLHDAAALTCDYACPPVVAAGVGRQRHVEQIGAAPRHAHSQQRNAALNLHLMNRHWPAVYIE
jgi:hypothetical protein